jgi:hypothetical protein
MNALNTQRPRDDERVNKNMDDDGRGSRAQGDLDRENDDGSSLTVAQRSAMIRSEFQQEALPRAPDIPGYHVCWLSTTNSYDPINKRMRLGYRPVSVDEVSGFESMRATSGEFPGCISCNEMLLFKVPEEIYQAIMQEFHHNMPLEEEEALKRNLVDANAVDSKGKKLGQITEDSDGFEDLGRRKVGVFA